MSAHTINARNDRDQPAIGGAGRAGAPRPLRCAIYTRMSTENGLEQEFNSLDGIVTETAVRVGMRA
ncbi:hypothetical protein LGH83_10945 [Lichenihabitans sp. PAMC28606]|uniref:hypothetical protein n=1 Tax=Lichenihabitans sp. PAMC28606 TaxID=2880932 RepID=UPI001D0A809A|nr:hypothetical protein [Lichenihabitans sp. PAMC28606]UDL96808.1 hypothetical protein LGH83_10945 [Lichenihabitans sp. PAMC28606]